MGGRRVSQIYRVYHLTEQSNKESVLDKHQICKNVSNGKG